VGIARLKETIKQPWHGQLIHFAPHIIVGIILIVIPLFLPQYLQSMMSKILIFALFAMSLDLIWGYTGLFSLGHAAFLGAAGYTTVILVNHYGVSNFWQTAPLSILIATLLAAILGYISLRVSGLFFLMVTLAFGQLLFSFAWSQEHITGGAFGLSFQPKDLVIPGFSYSVISIYYFVLLFFIICFFLLYRIVNSPFGYVLQGIREDEPRMRALGYNTWLYKYIAFIIAGLFAGIAGVLFAHWSRLMTPYQFDITTSTYALLCLILGGAGTLFGPFVGATLVVGIEYGASLLYPERWPLIMGVIFVIAVMFLRGGVYPRLVNLWRKVERYSSGSVKN
jgi:branched-chain amino acid transport system permease protein